MKIAVIGTSNSVIRSGYFETYKALEYPHQTDLYAVGGTIVSYAAFALEYFHILNDYDVIVTEFSTNDAHRYQKNIVSLEYLGRYIYDVFAQIRQTGKIHINLLLGHPNVPQNSPVFALYRQIGNMFQTCTVEAHEIITSLVRRPEELWIDQDHYKSEIIRPIAYVLHKERKRLTENSNNRPCSSDYLPVRKFLTMTFEKNLTAEQKGTTLYTLPVTPVKKSLSANTPQHCMQLEGIFYKASPLTGNVCIEADGKFHDCDLFKAASGFFYHYLTDKHSIEIESNKFILHNAKLADSQNSSCGKLKYNGRSFNLNAIALSCRIHGRSYPSFCPAAEKNINTEGYEQPLHNYIKIHSLIQNYGIRKNIITSINKPEILFVLAQSIEEKDCSAELLQKACCQSNYSNPLFLQKYMEKLLCRNMLTEIQRYTEQIKIFNSTPLNLVLCRYYLKSKQINEAKTLLQNELRKNPDKLTALFLLAKIFLEKQEYAKAEKILCMCRTINEDNLDYADKLLFCYCRLKEIKKIQILLSELEEYVTACAAIQYKLDFSELKTSLSVLSKDECGPFYPFVSYLKKNDFILKKT